MGLCCPTSTKVAPQAVAESKTEVESKNAAPVIHSRKERKLERMRSEFLEDLKTEDNKLLLLNGVSLGIFPVKHPLRQSIAKFVLHPSFDHCILFLIMISSLMLAVESPLWDPNSAVSKAFLKTDIVMTVAFTMEMLLKIITLGFLLHSNSYLRSAWNVLDFVIVIVSILSLAASDIPGLKSLRALRTLRVLRPLRLINRYPGLKLVVNALLASVPKIVDVLVVCIDRKSVV